MKKKIKTIIATLLAASFICVPAMAEVKGTVLNETGTKYTINAAKPNFEGFEFAKYLNTEIEKTINSGVTSTKESAAELAKIEDSALSAQYISFYDVHTAGDIISVVTTDYVYSGGAHGMTVLKSYTGFKNSAEPLTIDKLFKDDSNCIAVLKEKINSQITADTEGMYFETAKDTVNAKETFDYYIDGSDIVVYFSPYEIAPYAAGIPEFRIALNDVKDILKPEVAENLAKGQKLGTVRLNGETSEISSQIVNKDGEKLIPLRAVCDSLGVEIGWAPETGATVDGTPIKNVELVNGVSYIEAKEFSTDVSNKVYVNYVGDTLRMYK